MAIGESLIARQIGTSGTVLAVDVARKVPIQEQPTPVDSCDTRALRPRHHGVTSLVNLLEEERGIVASQVPATDVEWICGAIEGRSGGGVAEVGEIVVVSVNDDRAISDISIANGTSMKSIWRFATNTLREPEGEETYATHEEKDQADEAHLFPPGSLLFRTRDSWMEWIKKR